MAPCISNGPFIEALASIRIGSAASLPSGVISTRSLTLTSSEPDSEAGSFEQVLRCRRNAATSALAISAASVAGIEIVVAFGIGATGRRRHRRKIRRQAEQHLILDRNVRLRRLVGRGRWLRRRRWLGRARR